MCIVLIHTENIIYPQEYCLPRRKFDSVVFGYLIEDEACMQPPKMFHLENHALTLTYQNSLPLRPRHGRGAGLYARYLRRRLQGSVETPRQHVPLRQ